MSFNNTSILNDINIEIEDSDFVVITGESGSGKSTLLSILSTLEKPTMGEVFYDDRAIYKYGKENFKCELIDIARKYWNNIPKILFRKRI